MGWAGCSGWQEPQGAESGMMLQVQVRSGALSSPQVSGSRLDAPEGNNEFLQGCKTEGWELNLLGRPSPFEDREVAMLRGEREVESFSWHLWKERTG
ncbi:hypothetical protein RLOC_00013705 [Lonchura striata]|uniref:Uncharacterized protein n=1 Tax=Lonchura striata TaxID=40157 RepID=A0A218UQJ0_9PASE|nr:hypothetical protein RLOC_00013705 [Lonchura striata domestica]